MTWRQCDFDDFGSHVGCAFIPIAGVLTDGSRQGPKGAVELCPPLPSVLVHAGRTSNPVHVRCTRVACVNTRARPRRPTLSPADGPISWAAPMALFRTQTSITGMSCIAASTSWTPTRTGLSVGACPGCRAPVGAACRLHFAPQAFCCCC